MDDAIFQGEKGKEVQALLQGAASGNGRLCVQAFCDLIELLRQSQLPRPLHLHALHEAIKLSAGYGEGSLGFLPPIFNDLKKLEGAAEDAVVCVYRGAVKEKEEKKVENHLELAKACYESAAKHEDERAAVEQAAVVIGSELCVGVLLDHGSGAKAFDNFEAKKKRDHFFKQLEDPHVDVQLVEGISINSCRFDGEVPLSVAVRSGSLNSISCLIDGGAKTDWKSRDGKLNLVRLACQRGELEIVQLLDKQGVVFSRSDLEFAKGKIYDCVLQVVGRGIAEIEGVNAVQRKAMIGETDVGEFIQNSGTLSEKLLSYGAIATSIEIVGFDTFARCPFSILHARKWKLVKLLAYSCCSGAVEGLEDGLLREMSCIRVLRLDRAGLLALDPRWAAHAFLTELCVSHNRLTALTAFDVCALPCLTKVDVSYNEIMDVGWLCSLRSLESVNISGNLVSKLPKRLPQKGLVSFICSYNMLEELLASTFASCADRLKVLDVSYNLLQDRATIDSLGSSVRVLFKGNLILGSEDQFPGRWTQDHVDVELLTTDRLGGIGVVPNNQNVRWTGKAIEVVAGKPCKLSLATKGNSEVVLSCHGVLPAGLVLKGTSVEGTVDHAGLKNSASVAFVARSKLGTLVTLSSKIRVVKESFGIEQDTESEETNGDLLEPSVRRLALAWRLATYRGEECEDKRAAFFGHAKVRMALKHQTLSELLWEKINRIELSPLGEKDMLKSAEKALTMSLEVDPEEGVETCNAVVATLVGWIRRIASVENLGPKLIDVAQQMTLRISELLKPKDAHFEDHPTLLSTPDVRMDDVAGMNAAKQSLRNAVELPRQFSGLDVAKAVLLYGPPGTGKTMLAMAAATMIKRKCYVLRASDVNQSLQGDSEKVVRGVFEAARREPSVIIIDELDALLPKNAGREGGDGNRNVVTEFQQQMDGFRSTEGYEPLVIGITNYPHRLEEAIKRRFTRQIACPLPDTMKEMRLLLESYCSSKRFALAKGMAGKVGLLDAETSKKLDLLRKKLEDELKNNPGILDIQPKEEAFVKVLKKEEYSKLLQGEDFERFFQAEVVCFVALQKGYSGADLASCMQFAQEEHMKNLASCEFVVVKKQGDGIIKYIPCAEGGAGTEKRRFKDIPYESRELPVLDIRILLKKVLGKSASVDKSTDDYAEIVKLMTANMENAEPKVNVANWTVEKVAEHFESHYVPDVPDTAYQKKFKEELTKTIRKNMIDGVVLSEIRDRVDMLVTAGIDFSVAVKHAKWMRQKCL